MKHFRQILDQPNTAPSTEQLDIDTDVPTEDEVREAVLAMKSGKAPCVDINYRKALTADPMTATRALMVLLEHDTIPVDWSRGLIVKIRT